MTPVDDDVRGAESLEIGPAPRARWSRRTTRWVGVGVAALALVTVVVALQTRGSTDRPAPVVTAPSPSAGFAAGPVLVPRDGHDELTVPGGSMFGSVAINVVLQPDDDLVAVVRDSIPTLDHVRGGRLTDPEIHYGFYLEGAYTGADGVPVQLVLYTARAAGTPQSSRETVDRVLADGVTLVRTDASFYTGTGWWVHAVASAPDGTDERSGQVAVLHHLLTDSRLVA